MSTAVCLAYSNISDEKREMVPSLSYSLFCLKELEWKPCFYKLMACAAHLNIQEPQETNCTKASAECHQNNGRSNISFTHMLQQLIYFGF